MDTEKIKIYAGVISIVVTSIVSISTAFIANSKADKASQEETAKTSYRELSAAVEQMSRDQIAMSKDVASLRGYIAGINQQPVIPSETTSNQRIRISRMPASAGVTVSAKPAILPPPPVSDSPKPFVAKGLEP